MDVFIIPSLPRRVGRGPSPVGSLPSAGITRLHRYYGPIRHPLAFDPLPGVAGYRAYLLPSDLHSGPGGLLQLLSVSLPACCRYHSAGGACRANQMRPVLLPSPWGGRLGLRNFLFSEPLMRSSSLRPADSLTILSMALSMGFRSGRFQPPGQHAKRALGVEGPDMLVAPA